MAIVDKAWKVFRQSHPVMPGDKKLRYLYVVWAFVETLLFGGLIYGWGSLVFILKDQFVYWDLCHQVNDALGQDNTVTHVYGTPASANTTVNITAPGPEGESAVMRTCKEQASVLNLVFTVASSLFCVGCAVMGYVSFKFGTRVTRVLSMILFVTGALMIAFVSHEIPWLIFPGLTFIGIGGIPLLMTNTQISNLFTKASSTIVGLMCGAYDTSAGVVLVIKIAYEYGFSQKHSMFILTGLHSMVIVSTFFFLPKGFITKPETPQIQQEVAYKVDDEQEAQSVELLHAKKAAEDLDAKQSQLTSEESKAKLPTIWSCIFSSAYLLQVLWLSILQLRFYYYLSTLNPILNKVLNEDRTQVSYYTNVSMYMMMAGFVTSPFAGIVYDWQKGFFVNSRSQLRRDLMPSVIPLTIGTVLGLLVTMFCLIPVVQILYIIFITVTFFRSFLYCMGAAFVSAIFPSEYFGLLYGLMIICAGIISFLQYGLFRWAEMADYSQVNIFFLPLVALTLVHPVYQWIRCRRAESLEISKVDEKLVHS